MIRLNISQQFAKLGLDISEPQLNMKTNHPQIQLDTEPVIVEMHRIDGKLEIDQQPSRSSYGFKTHSELIREFAQAGMQAAIEAVGEIAAEGYRLTQIANGQNQIANIARESMSTESRQIAWTKVDKPNIQYEPGKIDYNIIRGEVDLSLKRGTVDLNLQRGQVNAYLMQYPSIRFWTSNIDVIG